MTERQQISRDKWSRLIFSKEMISKPAEKAGFLEVSLPREIAEYLFESYNKEGKNYKKLSVSGFTPLYLSSFVVEEWHGPVDKTQVYYSKEPPKAPIVTNLPIILVPTEIKHYKTEEEYSKPVPKTPLPSLQNSGNSSPIELDLDQVVQISE